MKADGSVDVGDAIVYIDSYSRERDALVTSVWGTRSETSRQGVNLVVVSNDEEMTDTYGRQIGRFTSVCHQMSQPAPGNYWREK